MKDLFGGVFDKKRILITGDTGFKGSWLSIWLHEMGAQVYGYALPPKSANDNFVKAGISGKVSHCDGNVTDYDALYSYAKEVNPEIVFHLAAQSLVIYSYENPRETYETNLMGTVNFLEVVRKLPNVKVAINVTSDKCYENKDWLWGYRENDPMGGKDPYSSSKGGSELITAAYMNSFFSQGSTSIASARAGNVIGGGDWAENRIVPDFFRAVLNNTQVQIRNPESTRPWQHVLEPLSGYLQLASRLFSQGQRYSGGWNFGPLDSNHYTVSTLIKTVIDVFGKGDFTVPAKQHLHHEAHLLKLDISKSMKILEWSPALDFRETVDFTVRGYDVELTKGNVYDHRVIQIKKYCQIAKEKRIQWAN